MITYRDYTFLGYVEKYSNGGSITKPRVASECELPWVTNTTSRLP